MELACVATGADLLAVVVACHDQAQILSKQKKDWWAYFQEQSR